MEKKIETALPLEYPEPSMGNGYLPLLEKSHPLQEMIPGVTSKWLDGWELAHMIIPSMLMKHSLQIIGFANLSPLIDGFTAYAQSAKLKQTNRIVTNWHNTSNPDLQSHRNVSHTDLNLHRFLEFSSKKLFPILDIVINDKDPMRKCKQIVIANAILLVRVIRESGYLVARWTDPRDWSDIELNVLNWLSQYGDVQVWLSPYPGRPTYVILRRSNVKISDKEIQSMWDALSTCDVDYKGPFTTLDQKRFAIEHSSDCGNATSWSEQFLEYIL